MVKVNARILNILTKLRIGDPKIYYNSRYWYGLALLNAERLFAHGLDGLWHRQLEAYYHTLLYVAAEKLHLVHPNKTAQYYRQSGE